MSLPKIILDTDKTTPIYELPLKIRQGDTGDELQVTLGKSFEKYTDLSTVDIELIAKTPDKRLIKQPVTDKSGTTFKVKFIDEMYTKPGVFRNMYFKIGDDSTSSVKLVVLQGIGSIKEAGSYIDDFETLIKEGQSYVLALKDFADTGNATIDRKVAELTSKMQSFVDKSKKDLDAAKKAWNTFQNKSETAAIDQRDAFDSAQKKRATDFTNSQEANATEFTDAQDKRTSDFNSQKAGFETDFGKQKTDFENRFKALLKTLQGDYDDFKNLINKDVEDFNTSLDSLDAQATDVKNKFDTLKAQLDLAAQNISGVRTNILRNARTLEGWTCYAGDSPSLGKSLEFEDIVSDGGQYRMARIFNNVDGKHSDGLSWPGKNLVLKAGQVYTMSIWSHSLGTSNQPVKLTTWINWNKDGTYQGMDLTTTIAPNWTRYSATFTANVGGQVDEFRVVPFLEPGAAANIGGSIYLLKPKLEKGSVATDFSANPADYLGSGEVQTAITNALDKANYSTTSEVDSKVATGVGQAKTYAEQTINNIIGAAPATLDTIAELADAVTENKDGVQAINDGITKKADKTDVTALQNTVQAMITSISQDDYDALVSAGTVDPKILYVIPDA